MEASHEKNEVIDLLLARCGCIVNKEVDRYVAYACIQQYRHFCGCFKDDFLVYNRVLSVRTGTLMLLSNPILPKFARGNYLQGISTVAILTQ